MYEERSEKFSLRDVLIQILFVTLFVFLMLWLFPTKSFVNNKIKNNYNATFNNNVNNMKEAAKSYFTNERLPQKVGEEEVLTLGDMLDLKIILPFVDGKGKSCDLNESYVQVTKEENEYLMKVYLKCTDYEDYLLVHMGCYDYCTTDICEKKEETKPVVNKPVVTTPSKPIITTPSKPTTTTPVAKIYEYQYLLVINGRWGNWSNWSAWTLNEAQATDYREVETKVEKVVSGTQSVVSGSYVDTVAATISGYTCPSGYTLSGNKCYYTSTSTDSVSASKSYSYSCPSGYSRNGSECTKTETSTVAASTRYTCPSGYSLSGSTCTKVLGNATANTTNGKWVYSYQTTSSSTLSSSSSTKYSLVGTKVNTNCKAPCTNAITYTYNVYTWSAGKTTYSCPSGTLSGTKCISTTSATLSYYCNSGTLSGSTCRVSNTRTTSASSSVSYSCPSGYSRSGSTCYKTVSSTSSIAATPTYACSDATYTLNGSSCSKTITTYITENIYKYVKYYRIRTREYIDGTKTYKWSRNQNDTNLINAGYTLTGAVREVQ